MAVPQTGRLAVTCCVTGQQAAWCPRELQQFCSSFRRVCAGSSVPRLAQGELVTGGVGGCFSAQFGCAATEILPRL